MSYFVQTSICYFRVDKAPCFLQLTSSHLYVMYDMYEISVSASYLFGYSKINKHCFTAGKEDLRLSRDSRTPEKKMIMCYPGMFTSKLIV
jgi:hypothetical protein